MIENPGFPGLSKSIVRLYIPFLFYFNIRVLGLNRKKYSTK